MRGSKMVPAVIAGMALLLAACGEKEPSKLTFGEVGSELAKGPAEFTAYLKTLPNRKVDWTGAVVEVRRWNEDDYMKAAGVVVDLDGKDGGDGFLHVKLGDADRLTAGERFGFVAEMSGVYNDNGRNLVELHIRALKK
jgi:hypothetical protein